MGRALTLVLILVVCIPAVYVGEAKPSVPRPAKELKGFSRVELAAGETKHVTARCASVRVLRCCWQALAS
jgi:hypothetical protein